MEEGLEGILELCVEFLASEVFLKFLVLLAGLFLGVRFASEGPLAFWPPLTGAPPENWSSKA